MFKCVLFDLQVKWGEDGLREMGETSPRLALEKKMQSLERGSVNYPKKSKDPANDRKSTSLCQDSSSFHIVCNGKHSLLYRPLYFGVKYWMLVVFKSVTRSNDNWVVINLMES